MCNKIMNNVFVALVFGILISVLGYCLVDEQASLFGFSFGSFFVLMKEIINNQMLDNPINLRTLGFGILGCLVVLLL